MELKLSKMFCLFVCGFSSHLRIFHPCWNLINAGEGLQILTFARHLWPLSSMGSLAFSKCMINLKRYNSQGTMAPVDFSFPTPNLWKLSKYFLSAFLKRTVFQNIEQEVYRPHCWHEKKFQSIDTSNPLKHI